MKILNYKILIRGNMVATEIELGEYTGNNFQNQMKYNIWQKEMLKELREITERRGKQLKAILGVEQGC